MTTRSLADMVRIDAELARADGLLTFDQLVDAATEEANARAWEEDMAHLRWAEAGGYAAGLARPCRLY